MTLNITKNEGKRVESGETSIKPWRWPHIDIYFTKKRDSLDWLSEPQKREMCVSHFPGSVAYILNIFVFLLPLNYFSYNMVWPVPCHSFSLSEWVSPNVGWGLLAMIPIFCRSLLIYHMSMPTDEQRGIPSLVWPRPPFKGESFVWSSPYTGSQRRFKSTFTSSCDNCTLTEEGRRVINFPT